MKREIPTIDGDEFDALTCWRHFLRFKPGERKLIKRRFNKRARRLSNLDILTSIKESKYLK